MFFVLTHSKTGKMYKKMQCLDVCLCVSKKEKKDKKKDNEVC